MSHPRPPHLLPDRLSPLTFWGGFNGQKRLSDSPYVLSIWEGTARSDGIHMTAADGTIDLTFQTRHGTTRLLLSGPTSHAHETTFMAGDKILTIRLRPGVHLPFMNSARLVNSDAYLPNANSYQFWLGNRALTFPDFNNVETFVQQLAKTRLLRRDIVVEDALANRARRTSLRTIQRHFLATTGLTMKYLHQIKRAEEARGLLASNYSLAFIAYEVGYSNPGHMTAAFKHLFGQTPRAVRALMKP